MQNIYSPGQCSVLIIDNDSYNRVFGKLPKKTYLDILMPFLNELPKRFLHLLEANSSITHYKRNAKLFLYDQQCRHFYCILNGEVSINMPKTKESRNQFFLKKVHYKEVLTISDGEYFGFEDTAHRSYEAQVKSVSAKVLEINLHLLLYVCQESSLDLHSLAADKHRLMIKLAQMPSQKAIPLREPIVFRPEKAVPKSHKSVFYTNSVRSSASAAFAKRDLPMTEFKSKPEPSLYEFNCLKYGTNFRKKKFL